MTTRTLPLLAVLFLAGCSAAPAAVGGSGGPVTGASAATTTPAPTTSAAPPSRTPVAVPAATGDVDGDGKPDASKVEGRTVRLALTGGGNLAVEVTGTGNGEVRLVGSADVDRDGRAEVWLLVDEQEDAAILRLVRYDGTAYGVVTGPNGKQLDFTVAADGGYADSVGCSDFLKRDDTGQVRQYASRPSGSGYTALATTYTLSGTEATPATAVTLPERTDPYVADVASCGIDLG